MSKDRGEVTFIRKNGRLIPIRKKKGSDKKKGAALTAAGAAVSVAGGRQAGKKLKDASEARRKRRVIRSARKSIRQFGKVDKNIIDSIVNKDINKQTILFGRKARTGKVFKFGASALGGALLGSGFANIVKSKGDSDLEALLKEVAAQTAGGLVALGARSKLGGPLSGSLRRGLKGLSNRVRFGQ